MRKYQCNKVFGQLHISDVKLLTKKLLKLKFDGLSHL